MGIREKIVNALGGTVAKKTTNTAYGNDFLKYGNRANPLVGDWSEVKISDEDMYKGYSYAVIQKRGNKVASLAKTNLKTWAKPEVVDAYQKKNQTPYHPYLKLIEDSKKFTTKQFYKNISIYLDLAGVYFLGVVRAKRESNDKTKFPDIITDAKEFIMLNPYEMRRVVNKDGVVAGYIERKKDGRYREWPKHMIIEMKELNPFESEKSQWSMTDAAKEAVYTINQSADYTRQSLNGNIEAPGIITTDVILADEDFANFKARVQEHKKGEPLFGNGAGAIKWDSMQVDLDRAALMDINEINRTTLFAVSGTSKTALGIEQSGTTRDTANVQREQLMSDTIQPRLEDIVDFLNLDYRQMYPREYEKTGYLIEVESAVSRDYSTETAAVGMREAQFNLFKLVADSGYTDESAVQYADGEIELSDLEVDEEKKRKAEEQAEAMAKIREGGNNDEEEQSDDGDNPPDDNGGDNSPKTSGGEDEENSLDGYENIPGTLGKLVKMDKELSNNETECEEECECHKPVPVQVYENDLSVEDVKVLDESYNAFLDRVKEIQRETLRASETKLTVNAFTENDIITEKKKKQLTEKLKNALKQYWWILVPLFGTNAVNQRNNEFGENYVFKFTNEMKGIVEDNAQRVAEGHMETILDDVLSASNAAFTKVVETAAGELLIKAYKASPDKYADFFDHIPTIDEAIRVIRKTDILERNRKIYEKANKMAREGYDRQKIVKSIREEYKEVGQNRAILIAQNETSRAFGKSQYEADYQFLNSIGKLQNAYKEMYSRTGNPCKYCKALIDKGPIPFTENFLNKGESITVNSNGKVSTFTADYEAIEGGNVHPRCFCSYRLVFKDNKVENENGVRASLLDGGYNLSTWIGNNAFVREQEKEINTTVDIVDGEKTIHIDLDDLGEEKEEVEEAKEVEETSEIEPEVPDAYFETTFVGDDYKMPLDEEGEARIQVIRDGIKEGKMVMPIICRRVEEGKYAVEAGLERLRAYYLEKKEPVIRSFTTPQDCLKYVEEHADEFEIV